MCDNQRVIIPKERNCTSQPNKLKLLTTQVLWYVKHKPLMSFLTKLYSMLNLINIRFCNVWGGLLNVLKSFCSIKIDKKKHFLKALKVQKELFSNKKKSKKVANKALQIVWLRHTKACRQIVEYRQFRLCYYFSTLCLSLSPSHRYLCSVLYFYIPCICTNSTTRTSNMKTKFVFTFISRFEVLSSTGIFVYPLTFWFMCLSTNSFCAPSKTVRKETIK